MVDLRVDVTPTAAHIFLDDKALPTNPWEGEVPRDSARHFVRAVAPGYITRDFDVSLDKSANLVLALERAQPEPPPPPTKPAATAAGRGPTPPATSSRPAPGPAKPDCSQPFYVDDRGIKKVKPECM
jgi:serine/threonine-protein kinase